MKIMLLLPISFVLFCCNNSSSTNSKQPAINATGEILGQVSGHKASNCPAINGHFEDTETLEVFSITTQVNNNTVTYNTTELKKGERTSIIFDGYVRLITEKDSPEKFSATYACFDANSASVEIYNENSKTYISSLIMNLDASGNVVSQQICNPDLDSIACENYKRVLKKK